MAVKFYLPDGSTTDIACQSWPVFAAGTPEGFLGLLRAQAQGLAATEQFLAGHPDIADGTSKIAAAGDPPRSWATMAFNSLNAYRLVNAAGDGQYARWRLASEAGEEALPVAERATRTTTTS